MIEFILEVPPPDDPFEFNTFGGIIIGVSIAGFIAVGNFLMRMRRCIDRQDARGVRQSKAIGMMARWNQHQLSTLHPSATHSDISLEVDAALKDAEGNY